MKDGYFNTKTAAQITGATQRQLQYWREKQIVIPTVKARGKGSNVFYTLPNLRKVAIMIFLLSHLVDFKGVLAIVDILEQQYQSYLQPEFDQKLMVLLLPDLIALVEYKSDQATTAINQGYGVIPLWLDHIYNELNATINC